MRVADRRNHNPWVRRPCPDCALRLSILSVERPIKPCGTQRNSRPLSGATILSTSASATPVTPYVAATTVTSAKATPRARELFRRMLPSLLVLVFPTLGVAAVVTGSKLGIYAVYAAVAACSLLAERYIPFVPVTRERRWRNRGTDIMYFLTSPLLFLVVQIFALPGMHALRNFALRAHQLWPSQVPVAAQVVIGLVVIEFAYYWVHRFNHGDNILWRSHRIHHTPDVLDALMNWRLHWLDGISHHVFARFGPLVLLGAPPKVVAIIMVMNITRSVFPHLNADVNSGRVLNFLFTTPEVHRWHHLQDPKFAQVNFGDTTNIWDHVFGTYRRPGATPRTLLGVTAAHRVPDGWLRQLLSPWNIPKRAHAEATQRQPTAQ
jgi:sterol desaturase/sphingolipid hydroxylase (fatty acid hydroxylase superfamily)